MTELERRALLGDKQAQEECTRQGIVLPCPLCKKKVKTYFVERHEEGGKGAIIVVPGKSYVECECGYSVCAVGKDTAIKIHNTRPAPPIGRCEECKHAAKVSIKDETFLVCGATGERIEKEDRCSDFEPRHPDAT